MALHFQQQQLLQLRQLLQALHHCNRVLWARAAAQQAEQPAAAGCFEGPWRC